MSNNPQLKKNLIIEALLEIRFDPNLGEKYSLVVGALNQKLKEYSKFEDLNLPDFGEANSPLDYAVRSRFRTPNDLKLYNLGKGILSINVLKYEGFGDFLKDIVRILNAHKEISNVKDVKRIGLRYINKSPLHGEIDNKFTFKFDLPDTLGKKELGFEHRSILKISENTLNVRYLKEPNNNNTILDFDIFKEVKQGYDVNALKGWIEDAHCEIYDAFKASLTGEYYNFLLND